MLKVFDPKNPKKKKKSKQVGQSKTIFKNHNDFHSIKDYFPMTRHVNSCYIKLTFLNQHFSNKNLWSESEC